MHGDSLYKCRHEGKDLILTESAEAHRRNPSGAATGWLQRADRQLQQPLYLVSWSKVDGKLVRFDQKNTGYGWKTEQRIDADVASQPTSCQMSRP